MKTPNIVWLITCLFLMLTPFSCRKYFENLNRDTKSPGAGQITPEPFFSSAQKSLSDYFAESNVNRNIFRFFAQYLSSSTYTNEPRFNVTQRSIADNIFRAMYVNVLTNLKEARTLTLTTAPENKARLGMIGILEVYAYANLVETFGDIPYTEALNPDIITPKYDDAKTVYYDLVGKLDTYLALLNQGGQSMGSADLVYGGDTTKWRKFGNGLKLKMALMLAKCDMNKAKEMVMAAKDKVFTSQEDSYIFRYLSGPPLTNPFYSDQILSNRKEYIAVRAFVDTMKSWDDPRLPAYFDTVVNNTATKMSVTPSGYDTSRYRGATYAITTTAASISQPNNRPLVANPDAPGVLMDYAEIQFYLCEACCRGMMTGGANCYFKKGIEASVRFWKGDTTMAKAFIDKQGMKMSGGMCSSTMSGGANGNFNRNLAVHMWVALYNRGYDGWNVWRRFGHFPSFFQSVNGTTVVIDSTSIPFRYTYPIDEGNKNQSNLNQAIAHIGGNQLTTKLFFFK